MFTTRKTVYLLLFFSDIAGHIQRGGGTGPMKPRQPPSQSRTGGCQCLRDVWRVSPRPHGGRHDTKGNRMAASQLTCRECGADYPLEARYVCHRCFGPLEVKYANGHLKADLPE